MLKPAPNPCIRVFVRDHRTGKNLSRARKAREPTDGRSRTTRREKPTASNQSRLLPQPKTMSLKFPLQPRYASISIPMVAAPRKGG